MTKTIYTLALVDDKNNLQKTFFTTLSQEFSYLFHITIVRQLTTEQLKKAQAIFTFQNLEASLPVLYFNQADKKQGFTVSDHTFTDSQQTLRLAKYLMQFYQALAPHFLTYLPFQARIADHQGQIIFDNHRFNGSFFASDEHDVIEDWILTDLHKAATGSKLYLIPTASQDHIYMQQYQALYDDTEQFVGVYDMILDFKPMLQHYLEETGQAIVGWSDVISGPSLSDHF
ncbi:Na+ driven multidrug efflux pump [Streptococcus equi subsp. equi]|uniref:Na+ driven multidrug efflux pump n=1 Tax=Streptococcus equi subsp. equi TaxID=148942 RepID=A0A380JRT1_9STRE|nr:multidrug transporter [Streptococcus equi]SUN46456.1 Na+ driven multidrug efflux pump [Streptococcus equi subsp. equi]